SETTAKSQSLTNEHPNFAPPLPHGGASPRPNQSKNRVFTLRESKISAQHQHCTGHRILSHLPPRKILVLTEIP
ncbi:MAG: hypothetical protein ACI4BH_04380, partial [Muribaculaceae bacterium]